jgi:hypothetical protein
MRLKAHRGSSCCPTRRRILVPEQRLCICDLCHPTLPESLARGRVSAATVTAVSTPKAKGVGNTTSPRYPYSQIVADCPPAAPSKETFPSRLPNSRTTPARSSTMPSRRTRTRRPGRATEAMVSVQPQQMRWRHSLTTPVLLCVEQIPVEGDDMWEGTANGAEHIHDY